MEIANDEEANRAIAALSETELDGRTIVVKPGNPKVTATGQAQSRLIFKTSLPQNPDVERLASKKSICFPNQVV